ncbi:MAG: hypothetical protein V4451_22430, partial [Pseudomonadota bacterium]
SAIGCMTEATTTLTRAGSVLIAIHELPYSSIEGLVKERLRPDLNGVFRALAKKERKGQYFSPKEKMQIGFSGEGGSAYE